MSGVHQGRAPVDTVFACTPHMCHAMVYVSISCVERTGLATDRYWPSGCLFCTAAPIKTMGGGVIQTLLYSFVGCSVFIFIFGTGIFEEGTHDFSSFLFGVGPPFSLCNNARLSIARFFSRASWSR